MVVKLFASMAKLFFSLSCPNFFFRSAIFVVVCLFLIFFFTLIWFVHE